MGYEEEQRVLDWVIPDFNIESLEEKKIRYFDLVCLETELISVIKEIKKRSVEFEETRVSELKPFNKKLEQIRKLNKNLSEDLTVTKTTRAKPAGLLKQALLNLLEHNPDLKLFDVTKEVQKAFSEKYDFGDVFEIEDCKGAPSSSNFIFSYFDGKKVKPVSKDTFSKAFNRAKKEISDK